jgi:hypothetical protein
MVRQPATLEPVPVWWVHFAMLGLNAIFDEREKHARK